MILHPLIASISFTWPKTFATNTFEILISNSLNFDWPHILSKTCSCSIPSQKGAYVICRLTHYSTASFIFSLVGDK